MWIDGRMFWTADCPKLVKITWTLLVVLRLYGLFRVKPAILTRHCTNPTVDWYWYRYSLSLFLLLLSLWFSATIMTVSFLLKHNDKHFLCPQKDSYSVLNVFVSAQRSFVWSDSGEKTCSAQKRSLENHVFPLKKSWQIGGFHFCLSFWVRSRGLYMCLRADIEHPQKTL